jgi:hypothetical protein
MIMKGIEGRENQLNLRIIKYCRWSQPLILCIVEVSAHGYTRKLFLPYILTFLKCSVSIYIYIYIYRERERERESVKRQAFSKIDYYYSGLSVATFGKQFKLLSFKIFSLICPLING